MKKEAAKPRFSLATILVCVSALFAPIYGGYIANDQTSLSSWGAALGAIFGGSDAPILSHLIIGFPIAIAAATYLVASGVLQLPRQILNSIWVLFFLFAGSSALFSAFKYLAISLWLEWILYGVALLATVVAVGRRRGLTATLGCIVAGCFVTAVKGVLEYGQERAGNPSWRIFAGWVNPNATAAILLMGFFIALALCATSERTPALLAGIASAIIAFAIVLTGSKGAVALGMPIGLMALGAFTARSSGAKQIGLYGIGAIAFLAVLFLFLKNGGWLGLGIAAVYVAGCLGLESTTRTAAMRLIGCGAGAAALVILLSVTTKPAAQAPTPTSTQPAAVAATPMARVAEGQDTQEQSVEFRKNLWKSALYLIKQKPLIGYGLGSYRFESARAALTTPTVFSHNVYLELWAECGALSFLLFLGGLGYWLYLVSSKSNKLPVSQRLILGGVVAAVISLLVHSLVDSDVYYFGIGLTVFILLGCGLLLAVDAVAPEYAPKNIRYSCAGGLILALIGLLIVSVGDVQKSIVRNELTTRDAQALRQDAPGLGWIASMDGDAAYLEAVGADEPVRSQDLKLAFQLSPSMKLGRSLAQAQEEKGDYVGAAATLQEALIRDPNNMTALSRLADVQLLAGDTSQAITTAQRLIAVEKTPYFQIRSLPEIVPTTTYLARFKILAPNTDNLKLKADLLAEGVRGMMEYAGRTARIIQQNALDAKDRKFQAPGYDTLDEAAAKLEQTEQAAKDAAELYGRLLNRSAAEEMEADERVLAGTLAASSSLR